MLGLLIVIALVAVPLLLLMRLSILMLARLFGVVSHSEVATRAEFARIREQLLLGGSSTSAASNLAAAPPNLAAVPSGGPPPPAPAHEESAQPHWRTCPECGARVPSVAVTCIQCGGPQ
jgi:outer membrane biosynthesis protein TonB